MSSQATTKSTALRAISTSSIPATSASKQARSCAHGARSRASEVADAVARRVRADSAATGSRKKAESGSSAIASAPPGNRPRQRERERLAARRARQAGTPHGDGGHADQPRVETSRQPRAGPGERLHEACEDEQGERTRDRGQRDRASASAAVRAAALGKVASTRSERREDLVAPALLDHQPLELGVVQCGAEPGEQVQVGPRRRAHQREERADRHPVERAEVDGLLEEAQRRRRRGRGARPGCARAGSRSRRRRRSSRASRAPAASGRGTRGRPPRAGASARRPGGAPRRASRPATR